MSLINQMLQDLDERRAAHGVGANLSNDVRPLPKARKSYWTVALAVGAGVVIALGIAGVFLRDDVSRRLAPVVATATQANAPAAPVAVAVPEAAVIEPQPEPVAEMDVSKRVDGVDVSLRMADFIEASGEADGVDTAETEPETDKRESSAAPIEAKSTVVQPAKPPVASAMTATPLPDKPVAKVADKTDVDEGEESSGGIKSTPLIERTPAAGSPHERAESEYRKAIAAVNQGRVSEAVGSLRNALRQDSLHVASRQLLVRLLLEAGNKDEAIRMLRDGIAGQPAQLGWAMSLARLQVDRGELDSAWQTLDHTLPAAGNNPDYLGFAANVLQRLGRHGEAADQYRKATRIAPADGRWWLGLGWCLDAQGQAAEAREAFLHARQSGNLSPELLALIDQKLR